MSRSIGIAHIVRGADGAASGVWGLFTIRTAFQPIFAFRNARLDMVAFEGLARPFRDGVPCSPGIFFGLVPPGERFHVEALLRTLHLLNAGAFLPADSAVFINFDPSVLTDRTVVDRVLREMRLVLHETGIAPARVVCEVTEQRLTSTGSFLYFLDALREAGFRIAVDDYGAEDSDVERVRRVRPHIVKFDAKWINRLMDTGPGLSLLSAMVGKFAEQGIATILEGIEEGWQLEMAERAGASMVQGFAIRRPELVPTSFAAPAPVPVPAPGSRARPPVPIAAPVPAAPAAALRHQRGTPRSFGRRAQ